MTNLSPGHRLGSGEILSPLDAGGAGRSLPRKGREAQPDVAITFFSAVRAGFDVARLRCEAQVHASLNHPNVSSLPKPSSPALLSRRLGIGPSQQVPNPNTAGVAERLDLGV
jgi:hypothetical protein